MPNDNLPYRVHKKLVSLLKIVTLHATFGEEPRDKTLLIEFIVIGTSSTYNAIISRPTLNYLRVLVST